MWQFSYTEYVGIGADFLVNSIVDLLYYCINMPILIPFIKYYVRFWNVNGADILF
jgi:hypothetical protein